MTSKLRCQPMRRDTYRSSTRSETKHRENGDRLRSIRRWTPQIFRAAAALILSTIPFLNAASAESTLCPDIVYLIEQSRTQFVAIRKGTNSKVGEYDSTFLLPGAWYCAIFEDAEKASYQCTWKYPHGDQRARKAFQRFVKEMRSCIGNIAEERIDKPVNHPDSFLSYYYQLPDGEASVALKNKSKLMSTLVSIGIDGFRTTK